MIPYGMSVPVASEVKFTNTNTSLYFTLLKLHPGLTCHFYRASVCEGGLGSRNSVCPSYAWIVTKLNDALRIF